MPVTAWFVGSPSDHVHLAGPDIDALQRFYEQWFGFEKSSDHGAGRFLRNDAGFLLALDPTDPPVELPAWFHLGFCLDSEAAVLDLHARMEAAAVPIRRGLISYPGEVAAFYCSDPAGTAIEVSWHAEDV